MGGSLPPLRATATTTATPPTCTMPATRHRACRSTFYFACTHSTRRLLCTARTAHTPSFTAPPHRTLPHTLPHCLPLPLPATPAAHYTHLPTCTHAAPRAVVTGHGANKPLCAYTTALATPRLPPEGKSGRAGVGSSLLRRHHLPTTTITAIAAPYLLPASSLGALMPVHPPL